MQTRSAHRIQSIDIHNLRSIRELRLDFSATGPTVIVGKNGTCKTTLLRAIAGLLGRVRGMAQLVSRGGKLSRFGALTNMTGVLVLEDVAYNVQAELHRDRVKMSEPPEPLSNADAAFVVAYGAGRYFAGPDQSTSAAYTFEDGTATLFGIATPLTSPELTIRRLQEKMIDDAYRSFFELLQRALGLPEGQTIGLTSNGLMLQGPGVGEFADFQDWADGHRVTLTWIADFFAQAMKADAIDENGEIIGILLVDEIEQHLHPSMQLEILPKLQALLPKCQIIVTTHSPLVAMSVGEEQVISLQKQADGTVVRVPTPSMKGLSAEDVLTHRSLFDSPAETAETVEARRIYTQAASAGASFGAPSVKAATNLLSRRTLHDIDPELHQALNDVLSQVKNQP